MKKLASEACRILATLSAIAVSQEAASTLAGSSAQGAIPYFGQSVSQRSRPSIDSASCTQLNDRLTNSKPPSAPQDAPSLDPARVFAIYLRSISAELGASIVEAVPDEFAWWIHVMGPVSALSLGAAVHESSHALERYLLICGNGTARFRIGGKIFSTGLRPGQTPGIADLLLDANPPELSLLTPIRREAYVIRATPGNDFLILLGEVSAYLADAHTELALYEQTLAGHSLFPVSTTSRNAGFSGLIDMLILLRVYLRQLEMNPNSKLVEISQKGEIVCLIAMAHGSAKSLVKHAIDRQLPQRLGFAIGLERSESLQFAELTEPASDSGFSYRQLTRSSFHQSRC
jgi:hypothetical protein